jgi:hypothetical protein
MSEIKLKIEDLILDTDNPRISHSEGQQEALQKLVKDQKSKLLELADSIVKYGLNPAKRMLVLRLNLKPERFISLEGNRRVAVFKMLTNPAVMSGLDMSAATQKAFTKLANDFKKNSIEPIACFELPSRQAGRYWLQLEHSGGHNGAGVDNWKSLAKRRFEGKPPGVQALELVTERAGLTQSERASITENFPMSTLERFLENKTVRRELGLDVKGDKLVTNLPADEVAKPLKKIVLDLATKKTRVGKLMKTGDMLKYIREEVGPQHLPDTSKVLPQERSLDEIPTAEFKKVRGRATRRRPDPSDRTSVVPKGCPVRVTDNRIADIYKELRTLRIEDARNAIAVLLRVFLELSVDHFLEANGGSLRFTPPTTTKQVWKKLDKKLAETVDILVSMGVPQNHFSTLSRDLKVKSSPMNLDLFHSYVHDRFATPSPGELTAAWDHAQPLFEKIWP